MSGGSIYVNDHELLACLEFHYKHPILKQDCDWDLWREELEVRWLTMIRLAAQT